MSLLTPTHSQSWKHGREVGKLQLLAHLQDSPSAFFQEYPILFLGSVLGFLRSDVGEISWKKLQQTFHAMEEMLATAMWTGASTDHKQRGTVALPQRNYMCGHCFPWLHMIRMNYCEIKYFKIFIFILSPFLVLTVSYKSKTYGGQIYFPTSLFLLNSLPLSPCPCTRAGLGCICGYMSIGVST